MPLRWFSELLRANRSNMLRPDSVPLGVPLLYHRQPYNFTASTGSWAPARAYGFAGVQMDTGSLHRAERSVANSSEPGRGLARGF
jgi:hypothetical protein